MGKLYIVFFALFALGTMAFAENWVNTLEFQGNGNKQTGLFSLVGAKWRLSYSSAVRAPLEVNAFDEDGKFLMRLCSYRDIQGPWQVTGKGLPDGKRIYLQVLGTYHGWHIKFEQYTDEVGGWKLHKERKEGMPLSLYGIWTGEPCEEIEVPIEIPARHWKLSVHSHHQGRYRIQVLDEAGRTLLNNYHFSAATSFSWGHAPGKYRIIGSSIGTAWTIKVEVEQE